MSEPTDPKDAPRDDDDAPRDDDAPAVKSATNMGTSSKATAAMALRGERMS